MLKEPQADCDVVVTMKTGVKNFCATVIAGASQNLQRLRLRTLKCRQDQQKKHELIKGSYC